uniref:Uncharacterized protein n=1 Tax=Anopheles atroparvus TaxID=41427 RepID=A0A182IMV6_ANOAO
MAGRTEVVPVVMVDGLLAAHAERHQPRHDHDQDEDGNVIDIRSSPVWAREDPQARTSCPPSDGMDGGSGDRVPCRWRRSTRWKSSSEVDSRFERWCRRRRCGASGVRLGSSSEGVGRVSDASTIDSCASEGVDTFRSIRIDAGVSGRLPERDDFGRSESAFALPSRNRLNAPSSRSPSCARSARSVTAAISASSPNSSVCVAVSTSSTSIASSRSAPPSRS